MSRKISHKKRSETNQLRRKPEEGQTQNKKKTDESKVSDSVLDNKEDEKG